MSVRRVCDICGREVQINCYTFHFRGLMEKDYDLCKKCVEEFRKWVIERKKAEEEGQNDE